MFGNAADQPHAPVLHQSRQLAYVNRPGLKIVARNGELVATPEVTPSNIRIQKSGFIADILVSQNGSGEIFHYVIQREGFPEIVHWGQEVSLQRAMDSVEQ